MSRKRVLILGGGHAGVRCARELIKHRRTGDEIDITIVSRENVEVWHGLMPQIVSGVLQAQHVLIPLREILPGVTIYTREIESIDPVNRRATLSLDGEGDEVVLDADYLVIALGSVTDLSRFPGLTEHALQTKTIGDFIHLRNHLIEMLEAASVTTDAAERQRRLTFVIAGAGYAGVEIASEANEFLRASLRSYPMISPSELRIITVDILTRVLPTFNDGLAQRVLDRMRQRGIELRLGVGIKDATASAIVLADGSRIETRSIIATVGIGTNPLVRTMPLELQRGRIPCDPFCRVPSWPGVYAVGDNAAVPDPGSGQPYGAMVMVAFGEGSQAARNIVADVRGQPLEPCHPARFGEVALLSRRYGVAQVRGIALHGWPASVVSRGLFLSFMPTWRRRLALALHWMGSAVLPDHLTPLPLGRSNTVIPMRFGAGELIVREGDMSGRFYIITSGQVEVVQQVDGKERLIRRLGPGDHFGEIALLGNRRRTATVRTVTDTSVLSLARQDFAALVEHLPALQDALGPPDDLK
ncbi:MAG TPA: FAD-dependent oxidoreductase [Candidatus Dormibacteraeota bacterium]|nr:FAD-dependent oxidoreductase [Candidatus Dormibacteraeota bacterium]